MATPHYLQMRIFISVHSLSRRAMNTCSCRSMKLYMDCIPQMHKAGPGTAPQPSTVPFKDLVISLSSITFSSLSHWYLMGFVEMGMFLVITQLPVPR